MDTRLSQLERDFAAIATIADRMDTTIERLAEVSTNVSKLLAVQDKRLEMQEKSLERLEALVENRRIEVDTRFDKTADLLSSTEAAFRLEITKNQEKISDQLTDIQNENRKLDEKFDKRIGSIEKWQWGLMGAGTVVGFVVKLVFFP